MHNFNWIEQLQEWLLKDFGKLHQKVIESSASSIFQEYYWKANNHLYTKYKNPYFCKEMKQMRSLYVLLCKRWYSVPRQGKLSGRVLALRVTPCQVHAIPNIFHNDWQDSLTFFCMLFFPICCSSSIKIQFVTITLVLATSPHNSYHHSPSRLFRSSGRAPVAPVKAREASQTNVLSCRLFTIDIDLPEDKMCRGTSCYR